MHAGERLKGIDVFVCVADAGSFTVAGERLHLTSSAVGKAIGRLEGRLGIRLFDRTTRAMSLTDAGAAFRDTCVRVLGELGEAEAVLGSHLLEPVGRLRIDAGATFGRLKVLPLLLQFAKKHPKLRPHLSLTDRFVDLVDEGIDVAVRIGGPAGGPTAGPAGGSGPWPPALGHRLLSTDHLVFCASPAYLRRRGTPRSAKDLLKRDAVVYGKADGTVASWSIREANGAAHHQPVAGRMIFGNAEAQVTAVRAGFGIAQLPTWLIDEALQRGDVVQVLPELATEGLPLYLVWQKNRQLLPKVAALLEMLASSLVVDPAGRSLHRKQVRGA